jgi:hypothetical protein
MDTLSIDGIDCICAARSEYECACDADWTTQEVYDLREEVRQLRKAASAYADAVVFMDINIDGCSVNAEGLLPKEVVANLNAALREVMYE